MHVYFLTVVIKGHVTLTSIMADNSSAAKVQAMDFFAHMLGNSAWAINCDYSEPAIGVTIWTLIPEEFKATLIKA